ncbi:hypothetical protein C7M84_001332 [Penaeus vannamei]|uniref:Uncharacterized protein n=1 Tax=Penaeus vannamei TaxID=6689 RepID=A0A423TU25_PENVA|nr:hypothetical protein C7M84_001332 [Penaeus vannamei]
MPAEGSSRSVLAVRRTGRPGPSGGSRPTAAPPGLAPRVLQRPPPLIGAWRSPRWPGVGRARHPFSGLVDSAVLLTKNGPLGAPIPWHGSPKQPRHPTYLKFENRSRTLRPNASNHWLYLIELVMGSSYPEGNFGGNQLLDDERFARQYRFEPPPEFPLASPRSGIVHHLSGPDRRAPTRTLHRRSGSASGAAHGSDGEPAGRCSAVPRGTRLSARGYRPCRRRPPGAPRAPGLWPPARPTTVHTPSRAADQQEPFRIRPGRIAGPHPLPSRQFQALFDSLFKVLFIFPSRYLFAIGLSPVFSLGRSLPPDLGCIPKQPDSLTAPRGATGSGPDGALTLPGAPFQGTWARSVAEDASPDYNSNGTAARFSSWAAPGSLAVTRGILVSFFSSAYLYA